MRTGDSTRLARDVLQRSQIRKKRRKRQFIDEIGTNNVDNRIVGDNLLTQSAPVARKSDAGTAAARSANRDPEAAGTGVAGPDVDRAQQRLSQEIDVGPQTTLDSAGQARQRVAQLVALISEDPGRAAAAHAGANAGLFEAATARPTA